QAPVQLGEQTLSLPHGAVVIAAITSCTNTSNPAVMLAAGLLAQKAAARGLKVKPWVKTSLAPGSQVVSEYLQAAQLMQPLQALGFHLVGYGCTTCIGNSGPVAAPIAEAVRQHKLWVTSVLSGNRNFEGRINPVVRANYLASPPLVVAYALAGTMDIDLQQEALGEDRDGKAVYLREVWPSTAEIHSLLREVVRTEHFTERYSAVQEGPEAWRQVQVPSGDLFAWDDKSTYIRKPPFFEGIERETPPLPGDIEQARVLVLLGDSVTTDHISPAGAIAADGPAARYLRAQGVAPEAFNSFGSRRGNHEVMMRGTFANIRLRNLLAPGTEGGVTRLLPEGEVMSIFDAAQRYAAQERPLVVIAGREYGTGSSRDWAAKGTALLGVKAVIAESYERIHRSNLAGMGVLPLQFLPGQNRASLGLTGEEMYSIRGIAAGLSPQQRLQVQADDKHFEVLLRLDSRQEVEFHRHGGILQTVLRQMACRHSV
ncbi:MAG: aconitate hydratase, partial [Polyangiales bacterium]